MTKFPYWLCHVRQPTGTLVTLLVDALRYLGLCLCSPTTLAAENLFLRKQLALYQVRKVNPQTRNACHLADLRTLIRRMARENSTWCEERIANELLLKLGLWVSPCTVRKYIPMRPHRGRYQHLLSQRWLTFVRNHAQAIVSCDFCVVVTATFRQLYGFVLMEHATRRILHANVTAHPTARWTLQQLRAAIPADHGYRFLIHDRDAIFSQEIEQGVPHLGLKILKTPLRNPQANALSKRLLDMLRRECLDFMIPLTEHHLWCFLHEWGQHYNAGRPHMALGQGIPQPPPSLPVPPQEHRHCLPEHLCVVARPILDGLYHEYGLEKKAA
jgi:transposase InsO family protein